MRPFLPECQHKEECTQKIKYYNSLSMHYLWGDWVIDMNFDQRFIEVIEPQKVIEKLWFGKDFYNYINYFGWNQGNPFSNWFIIFYFRKLKIKEVFEWLSDLIF